MAGGGGALKLTIETERESARRWIAEVVELPGVMLYGVSKADAVRKVKALARRVVMERKKRGERIPGRLTFGERPA